jgi:pimeloyl-ACP methyl ester carboxylesterase
MPDGRSYTTGSVISEDGTTIAYRQLGAGPGLVLVHGGMQGAQNLMRLAEALSDAFTLYLPNRRGRGSSGPPGEGYNLGKECEDIQALLTQTGAENIFGLSSGALISLQVALEVPSVRKVAAYEPPLSIDHSSPIAWLGRYDREIAEGRLASALVTVLKGLQASPAFIALPRYVLVPLLKLALMADDKNVKDGDVALRALVPTMHFDAQLVMETEGALESFKAIGADVLLLGGSKSQRFLRSALDALAGVIAHVRRVELQGLDHMGPDNSGKPGVVATELRRFLA